MAFLETIIVDYLTVYGNDTWEFFCFGNIGIKLVHFRIRTHDDTCISTILRNIS